MTLPADLINRALDLAGAKFSIGDPEEGTHEAQVALRHYVDTVYLLLQQRDWGFARQAVPLTLLKTAPVGGYGATPWTSAYPPIPWIYEYAYPANCIKVRSVRRTPVLIPVNIPAPNIFVEANDTASGDKVILTNLASAQAVITGAVMDCNEWQDQTFTDMVVEALAMRFKTPLGPAPQASVRKDDP